MSRRKTASVKTEGFEGILYPGNGRKDKVLIVMSGSNGGMSLTRQAAASRGVQTGPGSYEARTARLGG